jgi:transposase
MFVKVTSSGSRRYLQLVEAYRDDLGKPKQRTVATLGRLDLLDGQLDQVMAGLARATGKTLPVQTPPTIAFESARAFGDVWALTELWHALGFDRLRQVFGRTRHAIDIEALLRIMVFNRLCDPESKLGVLRWLETVSLPGLALTSVSHQQLLRAMDALVDQHEAVEKTVARLLRPLVDQELSVVFYDMTTIRAAGLSEQESDVRQFGMSKEGLIARQFMLGVVQTAEGLPLHHEVFDGNTAEVTTLKPTIEKLLARFAVKRMIVVADRGLLSQDNLAELQAITLPSGAPLEFILAVPGRRYDEVADAVSPVHTKHFANATGEALAETQWNGLRLVIAHNPETAATQTAARAKTIDALEQQATQWVGKLDGQDEGKRHRGRKLSDGGVRAKFYRAVCEAHLTRIIRVDLHGERFSYSIDEQALQHAQLMDGKLLLITNTKDLDPEQLVARYKSLADIERGFRVLKSEIEIAPVHHRLPERIRAHAAICFIALILYRIMRKRLHAAAANTSPERALAQLRRIQHHRITLNGTNPTAGLSTTSAEQSALLTALKLTKPRLPEQLTLL